MIAIIYLSLILCIHSQSFKTKGTQLIHTDKILLISTIDGRLIAAEKYSGNIKWTIYGDPSIIIDQSDLYFFPNPRDGTLFTNSRQGLKKLKATIPSIALSPPTTTDKLIYAGSKVDSWIDVDLNDGRILADTSLDSCRKYDNILGPHHQIPKTRFNIIVRDQETLNCKSNITYNEYYSHGSLSVGTYDLRHFASNYDGSFATFEPKSGKLLWINNFDGIVVNVYVIDEVGLITVPFITIEHDTFTSLVKPKTDGTQTLEALQKNFQPMVYIQKLNNGYYCLLMLIDKQWHWKINNYERLTDSESYTSNDGLIMEYSSLPTYDLYDLFMTKKPAKTYRNNFHGILPIFLEYIYLYSASFISIIIAVILSYYFSKKNFNSIKSLVESGPHSLRTGNREDPADLKDHIRVGKLYYDPTHVLGKGCDGTVVFKGHFDRRNVAVKRMLNHNKVLFEREIKLLIDCDAHENVCRYFCTENCDQFLYIALQYCMGSLYDYVHGTIKPANLTAKMCLRQVSLGLLHLHSLKIVHRDIKPQNILITFPAKNGPERAVISDFGFCRDLADSSVFSRLSGNVGTEGWMAPEMVQNDDNSVNSAADVFSLGCVFYYALTGGEHPFGDSFNRQAHIMEDIAIFDKLSAEHDNAAISLTRKMVNHNPHKRPTLDHVVSHPLFWNAGKTLSFLLETSDRIEKLDGFDPLVRRLEANNSGVIKESWTDHICVALRSDLGRFRTYKGRNLRDLLRAIRNKRNHYMELPDDVKASLGEIPGEFVRYFTNRFPFLLVFVYEAMELCCNEPNFRQFYYID